MHILFVISFTLIYIAIFCLCVYLIINRARILGDLGEEKVSSILSELGPEYKVFNDILIKNNYGMSQIDHLVVSAFGIFVIETKNYKGWIFGQEHSNNWTQNIWGNKFQIINPIRQNYGHIKALRNSLPMFVCNQYISIIVFSDRATLKINVNDEQNIIYMHNILSKIKEYQQVIISESQQNEYITQLQQFLNVSKEDKLMHIASLRNKRTKSDMLTTNGICPICGGFLIQRRGKYGIFHGCSNYPKCRFSTNNLQRTN